LITLLKIGAVAVGSDGYRGEVRAVVIDPVAATVTHVAVEPDGRSGLARLVPLGQVDADPDAAPGQLRLRYTEAEFMTLDPAEETLGEFAVGQTVPVQLIPPGWRGTGEPVAEGGDILRIPERETVDVSPSGEVEEHGGDHVHATDGDIGRLHGFRLDPASGRVTHVLLGEGHLWGRKEVAIPFDKIAGFDHGIKLSLTKKQVQGLPAADIGDSA
jgi:sporulation protein YlmC with PRC-barrel domain